MGYHRSMSASPPVSPVSGPAALDPRALVDLLRQWGRELGFDEVGIADLDLAQAGERLAAWVGEGMHGEMDYMERHLPLRQDPTRLVSGARSAIMVRMDYAPLDGPALAARQRQALEDGGRAVVATYALGPDYHKVLRQRLQRLADRIAEHVGPFGYRVFTDSAPVMEVELARKAGLGWRGKHTLLLSRDGSWFFLGEILTDLPLPADSLETPHCGQCRRCIDACPTGAIVAPYVVDARRCISYLTIELKGSIPEALRPAIGTRVYGCDDCQTACPWNKYARACAEGDFAPRHGLDTASLLDLFAWSERDFDERTQGSAIRRIGYERWLRNLAVALGNAPASDQARAALRERADHPSELVREHVRWALERQSRGKREV